MRFTIHSKAASTSLKMIIAFPGEADCDLFLCSSALSELRFFKKQPQNAFWGIRVALFQTFPCAFLRKGNCKIRFTESGLPFRQDTKSSPYLCVNSFRGVSGHAASRSALCSSAILSSLWHASGKAFQAGLDNWK